MLVSLPVDAFRTARDDVADDAASRFARKALDDRWRKAVGESRERPVEMKPRNFPVSGGAVLTGRRGPHCAPRPRRVASFLNASQLLDVAEAELLQPGEVQSPARAREIAECVASRVSVDISIRCSTNSRSVENDYRGALHAGASTYTRSARDRSPVRSSYGDIFASSA